MRRDLTEPEAFVWAAAFAAALAGIPTGEPIAERHHAKAMHGAWRAVQVLRSSGGDPSYGPVRMLRDFRMDGNRE